MSHSAISLGLGLGGGKSATSSGAPGGGGTPFENLLSAEFDGTNDYAIIPADGTSSGGILNSTDADVDMTISMWLKPLATSSGTGIEIFQWADTLSSGTPFLNASTTRVYINGGFRHTFQSGEINDSAWNNLVLTRTASDNSWRGFVAGNGSPIFTYDDGGSLAHRANADDIYLANLYFGYGNIGLDEVALWNTNQGSNVATIYNSGVPGDLSSLSPVGWWRMGDGTGDVNASGGTPANGGAIGTIVNQGSGSSINATGQNGPTFSNSVPS